MPAPYRYTGQGLQPSHQTIEVIMDALVLAGGSIKVGTPVK
jgi:hypothetical protein